MWERFRAYDYAYLFGFSVVLPILVVIGIVAHATINLLRLPHASKNILLFACGSLLVCYVIIQKMDVGKTIYGPYERNFELLRHELQQVEIPENSQIIITGISKPLDYMGVIQPNSGYLRYGLGRRDVTGILGSDNGWHDVFKKVGLWSTDSMSGLKRDKPIVGFTFQRQRLRMMKYLLSAAGSKQDGEWTLYDLMSDNNLPKPITNGIGVESFLELRRTGMGNSGEIRSDDILFAKGL